MKIGDKVVIKSRLDIVKDYWDKVGEVIEVSNEDIIKRIKPYWNPTKIGEQLVYRIKFDDETLPTSTLLLPIEFLIPKGE